MKKINYYEGDRSGDLHDMQQVEAAVKRWHRDLPYIKRSAFGRYAPTFCYGQPGINIEIRNFKGTSTEFYALVDIALLKRFYQPETRRKYLSCLKRFLKWLTVPVGRVTEKCIYAYFAEFRKQNIKPATLSLHFSALRTIFDCFCNLEITNALDFPKEGKEVQPASNKWCGQLELRQEGLEGIVPATEDDYATKEEIQKVFSFRHSARNMALFCGLLLLDIKLNEFLNIRRKDVLIKDKKIIVWGGLGRREREIELPEELVPFFIERMNETYEEDYLFSSMRYPGKALSGKGANLILSRILENSGINKRVTCREIIKSGIDCHEVLSIYATKAEILVKQKALCFSTEKKRVGNLNIIIGELTRRKGIVSAKVELILKPSSTDWITLFGITVSELSYRGPSLYFPYIEKWEIELNWVSREVKERIESSSFKENLTDIIKEKYLEKRKNCYIRKEKINRYWEKTG